MLWILYNIRDFYVIYLYYFAAVAITTYLTRETLSLQ